MTLMKEILRMWFFVRFFNKRQKYLASRDKANDPIVEDILKANGQWQASVVDAHVNTSKYMVAPYILKEQFILNFFLEYLLVKNSGNEYVDPKKFPNHADNLKYVNKILLNCTSEKYDFLHYGRGKDEKRLYVTVKGEQFSTFPVGLLREWAIYLKPIYSVTIIGIIIEGLNWMYIYLSPWLADKCLVIHFCQVIIIAK